MDDRYMLNRQGSGVWRSLRDGDFEEGDVWDVLKERKDYSPKAGKSIETPTSLPRNLLSASRMIPRSGSNGSSSSGNSFHETKGIKQQSAPVNIPDWSKIYGNKSQKASSENSNDVDDDYYYDDDDDDDDDGVVNHGGDSDDDDDEYNYKVPPHEVIARRLARSHISSFSVFEGAGRTLKGRDLSKVRNAILTKTGFLE